MAHCTYLTGPKLPPMPCHDSAWLRLYHSQNDRAFITMMGFNVATFNWILGAGFNELWNLSPISCTDVTNSASPQTYRKSLDAAGALGLVLHFLGFKMTKTSLQQIFALIPAPCSRYINFGLEILLKSLLNISKAAIGHWPEGEQFEELTNLVLTWHPLLSGVLGQWMALTWLSRYPKIKKSKIQPSMASYTIILLAVYLPLLLMVSDRY